VKRFLTFLYLLLPGLFLVAPASSFAKVKVFAYKPEWTALAEEIGRVNGLKYIHIDTVLSRVIA